MLGFDEVLSPGIACDETFALLDGVLTLGFYEALSLEVMHEEPRVLFGRVACAWLPRGRLAWRRGRGDARVLRRALGFDKVPALGDDSNGRGADSRGENDSSKVDLPTGG